MERNGFFVIKIAMAILFGMAVAILPLQAEDKEKIDQKKADISKMAEETLASLYKDLSHPTKQNIADAAGYAVFSSFGMKLKLVGGWFRQRHGSG